MESNQRFPGYEPHFIALQSSLINNLQRLPALNSGYASHNHGTSTLNVSRNYRLLSTTRLTINIKRSPPVGVGISLRAAMDE
jgi:hypothetical protein